MSVEKYEKDEQIKFRHFVPSRWQHPLAPLKRLSPVDLPSANSIKCCSPPASLKATKMNFMEQTNRQYERRIAVWMITENYGIIILSNLIQS